MDIAQLRKFAGREGADPRVAEVLAEREAAETDDDETDEARTASLMAELGM
jgi:hypothetical protein